MRVIFLEYDCELSDKRIVIYFHPTDTFLVTLDDFLNCPQTNLALVDTSYYAESCLLLQDNCLDRSSAQFSSGCFVSCL